MLSRLMIASPAEMGRRASAALCLAAVALAACGSDRELGGAEGPSGYETFEEAGVSFAVPSGWQPGLDTSGGEEGAVLVRLLPEDATEDSPFIQLYREALGDRSFDEYLEQSDELPGNAEALDETVEEVEVSGAERAELVERELEVEGARGANTALRLETDGGDVVSLIVGVPEGDEDEVDADAVVDSFTLTEDGG